MYMLHSNWGLTYQNMCATHRMAHPVPINQAGLNVVLLPDHTKPQSPTHEMSTMDDSHTDIRTVTLHSKH